MTSYKKIKQDTDIPIKFITHNSVLFFHFIFTNLNDSIAQSTLPSLLKLANITPVLKKDSKTSKDHYKPVSILSNILKIYEKFLFKKMFKKYFEPFFLKFQCGFKKAFCQCLRNENWHLIIKKDLSKAFDCLSHDLLIAKFNAYGLSADSLTLVQDFGKPQTKKQNKCSMHLLERNFIRISPEINFRVSFIEHIFMWFVFHHG